MNLVEDPLRGSKRTAAPICFDEGATNVGSRAHAIPHCKAVHLLDRRQCAHCGASGDERQQSDEARRDAHSSHVSVDLDGSGWVFPGLGDRGDHGVEAGGGRGDVHVVKRPHRGGEVARPDVDGDHGAPDDGVAGGQFVEQAAGEFVGSAAGTTDDACAVGRDERGGEEGAGEEATLGGERVEGGGGAGHAERGGGLEREREGVGEGGVSERREVRGGEHAGEEAERVAVAAGVHVGGQQLRQRGQALVAGGRGHRF